ncbi:MAG: YfhO family protein, partial [Lachnoclostridium sp.]|nr:YfhO family protein [Lachnoclostridium sp.]
MVNKKKNMIYITSFALPIVVLVIVEAFLGFSPFGEKTVLFNDLNGQYISYLSFLRNNLLEQGSNLYSFAKGMGGGLVGFGAYYYASPINMLLVLFDTELLPYGIWMIQLLRIGLSGLTMNLFLNREGVQAKSVIFSFCYALMAYSMVYSPHIMWMDAVVLLPLIVLGIERINNKKSSVLYVISLCLAIIVNYYLGFMLCIFSLLYFCYHLFCAGQHAFSFKKEELYSVLKFVISSVIAAGMSAFVLLPALSSLQGGDAKFSAANLLASFHTNFSYLGFTSKLFPGSFSAAQMGFGMPNVYCGMLMILFGVVFFCCKKISLRRKIGFGILIAVIFFSFKIEAINLLWHAFNEPDQFPYRYSFIFSFLVITAAYQGYQNSNPTKVLKFMIPVFSLFVLAAVTLSGRNVPYLTNDKIMSGILILMLILGTFVYVKFSHNRRRLSLFLLLICFVDLGINMNMSMQFADYANYSSYEDFVQTNQTVIDQVKKKDTSFYRMEKTYQWNHNDSMMFGYNGLSHFSSDDKVYVREFLGKMGFRNNNIWAYYNQGSSISADSLLGVKYILSKSPLEKPYNLLWQYKDISVYQNPYALPIGFMVEKDIKKIRSKAANPFQIQNKIWASITGITENKMYSPALRGSRKLTNLRGERYGSGIRFTKINSNEDAFIEWEVKAASDDTLYTYLSSDMERDAEIFVNDRSLGTYFNAYRWDIVNLGKYKKEETITFKIKLSREEVFLDKAWFYHEDMGFLAESTDRLSRSPLH